MCTTKGAGGFVSFPPRDEKKNKDTRVPNVEEGSRKRSGKGKGFVTPYDDDDDCGDDDGGVVTSTNLQFWLHLDHLCNER